MEPHESIDPSGTPTAADEELAELKNHFKVTDRLVSSLERQLSLEKELTQKVLQERDVWKDLFENLESHTTSRLDLIENELEEAKHAARESQARTEDLRVLLDKAEEDKEILAQALAEADLKHEETLKETLATHSTAVAELQARVEELEGERSQAQEAQEERLRELQQKHDLEISELEEAFMADLEAQTKAAETTLAAERETLTRQLEEVTAERDKVYAEKDCAEERSKETLAHLQAQVTSAEAELVSLTEAHELQMAEFATARAEKEAELLDTHQAQVEELEERHRQALEEQAATLTELAQGHEADSQAREQAHREETERLTEAHQAALQELQEKHEAEVAALKQAHSTEEEAREGAHRSALEALQEEHRQDLEMLETRFQEEREAWETVRRTETESLAGERTALLAKHQEDLTAKENSHREAIQALAEAHRTAMEELEAQHTQALAGASATHQSTLDDLEAAHQQAREEWEARTAKEQDELVQAAERQLNELAEAKAHLEEKVAQTEAELMDVRAKLAQMLDESTAERSEWEERELALQKNLETQAEALMAAHQEEVSQARESERLAQVRVSELEEELAQAQAHQESVAAARDEEVSRKLELLERLQEERSATEEAYRRRLGDLEETIEKRVRIAEARAIAAEEKASRDVKALQAEVDRLQSQETDRVETRAASPLIGRGVPQLPPVPVLRRNSQEAEPKPFPKIVLPADEAGELAPETADALEDLPAEAPVAVEPDEGPDVFAHLDRNPTTAVPGNVFLEKDPRPAIEHHTPTVGAPLPREDAFALPDTPELSLDDEEPDEEPATPVVTSEIQEALVSFSLEDDEGNGEDFLADHPDVEVANPLLQGQAPLTSEAPKPATSSIPTAPPGVPVDRPAVKAKPEKKRGFFRKGKES